MTAADIKTLLEFHYWARDRILDAVELLTAEQWTRDLGSSFPSVRDTLTHVYSSEWVWYERWQGRSPTAHLALDQFQDVAALRAAWRAHQEKMLAFLTSLNDDGLARVIDYHSFAGVHGSSAIWQMVQHIVNHATYHRGQVTTMLRQLGAKPAKSLDLIAFYRGFDAPPKAAIR
jgi:uncharacterized damage-inducible protein DinB